MSRRSIDSSSSASSSDLGDVRDIDAEESVLQDDVVLNRGALDRYRALRNIGNDSREILSGKGYGHIDKHIDLWLAAKLNHVERIRELVEDVGVSPNIIDKWDATPLYYTSSCGYLEATKFLLHAGATADPHQFVGARCIYAALNDHVRQLLRDSSMLGKRKSPVYIAMATLFRNANASAGLDSDEHILRTLGDASGASYRFDGSPDFCFRCLRHDGTIQDYRDGSPLTLAVTETAAGSIAAGGTELVHRSLSSGWGGAQPGGAAGAYNEAGPHAASGGGRVPSDSTGTRRGLHTCSRRSASGGIASDRQSQVGRNLDLDPDAAVSTGSPSFVAIRCHRLILAAASEQLAHRFSARGKWRDKASVLIKDPDIPAAVVQAVVEFCYTDRLQLPWPLSRPAQKFAEALGLRWLAGAVHAGWRKREELDAKEAAETAAAAAMGGSETSRGGRQTSRRSKGGKRGQVCGIEEVIDGVVRVGKIHLTVDVAEVVDSVGGPPQPSVSATPSQGLPKAPYYAASQYDASFDLTARDLPVPQELGRSLQQRPYTRSTAIGTDRSTARYLAYRRHRKRRRLPCHAVEMPVYAYASKRVEPASGAGADVPAATPSAVTSEEDEAREANLQLPVSLRERLHTVAIYCCGGQTWLRRGVDQSRILVFGEGDSSEAVAPVTRFGDAGGLRRDARRPKHFDLRLFAADYEFLGSRAIFMQRSPYFRATLAYSSYAASESSGETDGEASQIELEGMQPDVVRAVTVFLLTDELVYLEDEHLPELIEAADLFMVESLRACAVQEASKRVSLTNLCAMWRLGELLGLQRLSDAAASFAAARTDQVVQLADFVDLVIGSAQDIVDREEEDSVPVLDDAAAAVRLQFGELQYPDIVAYLLEVSPVGRREDRAAASRVDFPFRLSVFHQDGGDFAYRGEGLEVDESTGVSGSVGQREWILAQSLAESDRRLGILAEYARWLGLHLGWSVIQY